MQTAFSRDYITGLETRALKSLIATTNPTGKYRSEVEWAKEELTRRNVDYADCLGGD